MGRVRESYQQTQVTQDDILSDMEKEKPPRERLSRRADRLAGTDSAKTHEVPDGDYFRDIAQKPESVPTHVADETAEPIEPEPVPPPNPPESEAKVLAEDEEKKADVPQDEEAKTEDEPGVHPEKVARVAKSFNYVGSGSVDPKNNYRVVLTGKGGDGAPVERIVMIPYGMLNLSDRDIADPATRNDEIMEAIRRIDAGEIPPVEPKPKVDPLPKVVVPAHNDAPPYALEHFQEIGPMRTAAATEKKTMKPHRFIPLWALPFLAPFAVVWGMWKAQVKTIQAYWWASGKVVGAKEEKGKGGGHAPEHKPKKADHGGGDHGKKDH